jgi:hypothetical protein
MKIKKIKFTSRLDDIQREYLSIDGKLLYVRDPDSEWRPIGDECLIFHHDLADEIEEI